MTINVTGKELNISQSTELQGIGVDSSGVSEKSLDVVGVQQEAKKTAYFWIKADLNDRIVTHKDYSSECQLWEHVVSEAGYEVKVFKGNMELLEHIKNDPTPLNMLVIEGHGSPWSLEDFKVENDEIICKDSKLSKEDRNEIIGKVGSILSEKSITVLSSCGTGNKSEPKNFASILSKVWTSTQVFAFQDITSGPPHFKFEKGDTDTNFQLMGISSLGRDNRKLAQAVIYENGVETTGQKTLPIPKEFTQTRGFHALLTGGILLFSGVATIGMGLMGYDAVEMTTSVMSQFFG